MSLQSVARIRVSVCVCVCTSCLIYYWCWIALFLPIHIATPDSVSVCALVVASIIHAKVIFENYKNIMYV